MLTVGLDFDGVMYDFVGAVVEWARDATGLTLPTEPERHDFWRGLMPDEGWEALLEAFAEDGGYRVRPPQPDALEGIKQLFDDGHDLIGVSSRPATRIVEASTYGWVSDWMLPLRSVLLGPAAKLEAECDLIVDDDPAALGAVAEMAEAVGVLMDRPWNRTSSIARVSWAQLPLLCEEAATAVAACQPTDRLWALEDAVDKFMVDRVGE